ncbi:MAG: flagellar hook capping FlgD N-terminal domain-containing protein [Pseudomonadota bacterium]
MTTSLSGNPVKTFATPAATAPATPTLSGATKDANTLNQNFDQFLLLLTTQLKNQDPLAPMDSTQFTNQLVSFSGVEQQIKMNDSLSKMLALSQTSQTALGLSYIGLNVALQGSQFEYPGSGVAQMSYTLPSDAAAGTVTILDGNNNVVYSQNAELSAGKHKFYWNGQDQNGTPAPAGAYTIRVGAIDKDQKNITATTIVPGMVTGVMTADDGSIDLIIGTQYQQTVPLSSITQASL